MAYNKTNWQSLPSTDTPISVGNLNKIENGIYDNSLKADQIGDLTELETIEKSTIVEAVNENTNNISKFGKKLWEGTFTSGSITVDGLEDYTVIIVVLDRGTGVYCIGNKDYGLGGVGDYASYTLHTYSYRFENPSPNVLEITTNAKGGSDGISQAAVKAIYGLF